ncbi:MAG: rhodanese-like domain-containing protein [Clostridia bacterium]|nr:rhodanese-like domain-containing protein [Clostridia bacterium]
MLFANINKGVEECRRTENALLVDVREVGEYAAGHIPGAVNAPLSALEGADLPADRPLFLYCLRGSRSARAAGILKRRGYSRVRSIGGIVSYRGEVERG